MSPVQAPGYDWLSRGGAYWIILCAWVASAAVFYTISVNAAKRLRSENDGCLIGMCCILLAATGGGVGLYLGLVFTRYPNFILTSVAGTILVPAVGSAYLVSNLTKRR